MPIMAGLAVLAGTSSMMAARHGSSLKKSFWKGVLGRRGYEIVFQNLVGESDEATRVVIRRVLRWIGYLDVVVTDTKELMRYSLKEADGSITTLRLPLEPFSFVHDGISIWATMNRNAAGLIQGFSFWTKRYGGFTKDAGKRQVFEGMMAAIDRVIDGKEKVEPVLDDPETLAARLAFNERTEVLDPALLDRTLNLLVSRADTKVKAEVANQLACFYDAGSFGVIRDERRALHLWRLASKSGCLLASRNLALVAMERGDFKTFKVCMDRFMNGLKESDAKTLPYAETFWSGIAMHKHKATTEEAKAILKQVEADLAAFGHDEDYSWVDRLVHLTEKDDVLLDKAHRALHSKTISPLNRAKAANNLGFLYQEGKAGLTADPTKAKDLYTQAAKDSLVPAANFNLANLALAIQDFCTYYDNMAKVIDRIFPSGVGQEKVTSSLALAKVKATTCGTPEDTLKMQQLETRVTAFLNPEMIKQ